MATPPTRSSYNAPASGNYSSAPASFTTGTFNVASGDIIVVQASSESALTPASVTPSASGGSVTWTLQANQTAGNTNQSGAKLWTGICGAAGTGITVTLNRITTEATPWWGMSATVWTAHGGVGVVFQGNNGTGSGAPSVAATCSANSAVQCLVNDWNASSGARTWRTINGAAETESLYFTNSSHHTAFAGYRADTGTAGSITQGLTAPSGQRYVLVGVEILGASGGGSVTGDASLSVAASRTGAGVVGAVGAAASAITATFAAAALIATSAGASSAVTATITASGVVGTSSGATLTVTESTTASGSTVSGFSGSASLAVTDSITAAGVVATSTGASLAETATIAAAGTVGASTTASLAVASTITAAGTVVSGLSGSGARATTVTTTAAGAVQTYGAASLPAVATITAAGVVGRTLSAVLPVTVSIVAAGEVHGSNDGAPVLHPTLTGTAGAASLAGSAADTSLVATATDPTLTEG